MEHSLVEIELTQDEVVLIKLCKGHFDKKYGIERSNNIDVLKPYYNERYLANADESPSDFKATMFHVMFDLYMKITDDVSPDHRTIKELFFTTFEPSWTKNNEATKPIDRALSQLVTLVRHNRVVGVNGIQRYDLGEWIK